MTDQGRSESFLSVENLSVTYVGRGREVRAVRNCSFSFRKGNMTGLVGESGSGKSSVLMAIPRLLPAGTRVTGSIVCGGEDLTAMSEQEINARRWRRMALVPQGAMNSFTPHLSIERHITEVLEHHLRASRAESRKKAAELIRSVGLEPDIMPRFPHELSGGQRQRAALAAATACDPDFLLADEPTTALDVITQKEVLDTLKRLTAERGMGLLLVTHDLPLAANVCETLLVMKDGEIVERGDSGRMVKNPEHPYTRALIGAIRDMESGRPS